MIIIIIIIIIIVKSYNAQLCIDRHMYSILLNDIYVRNYYSVKEEIILQAKGLLKDVHVIYLLFKFISE